MQGSSWAVSVVDEIKRKGHRAENSLAKVLKLFHFSNVFDMNPNRALILKARGCPRNKEGLKAAPSYPWVDGGGPLLS